LAEGVFASGSVGVPVRSVGDARGMSVLELTEDAVVSVHNNIFLEGEDWNILNAPVDGEVEVDLDGLGGLNVGVRWHGDHSNEGDQNDKSCSLSRGREETENGEKNADIRQTERVGSRNTVVGWASGGSSGGASSRTGGSGVDIFFNGNLSRNIASIIFDNHDRIVVLAIDLGSNIGARKTSDVLDGDGKINVRGGLKESDQVELRRKIDATHTNGKDAQNDDQKEEKVFR